VSGTLNVRDRGSGERLDLRLLKRLTHTLVQEYLQKRDFEVGVYIVGEAEMTRLNGAFLQHAGSTDVITFDYADPQLPSRLAGEIVVCLDVARSQARRFRTTWQAELVRYVAHGCLHLCGHDDHQPQARRRMKREENRLVRQLARQYTFGRLRLGGTTKTRASAKR
jgi:probable rRNA maturation factor